MALAGAAWSAVLIVALLAGVRLLPTAVAAPVAAVLALPSLIVSVVADRRRLGLGGPPRPVLFAAAGAFFLFWLAGITAFNGLGGNASVRDGQYVLDNHGSVTVVDKAAYDRRLAREQRLVLAGFGAFGVGGAYFMGRSVALGQTG